MNGCDTYLQGTKSDGSVYSSPDWILNNANSNTQGMYSFIPLITPAK